MYYELGQFSRHILTQRALWKDGDLWTAFVGGIGSYCWFNFHPETLSRIQAHFNDLLTVTSIVFGFSLASLLFYIEAASRWSKEPAKITVAEKIVDWHVWTILCLLLLVGYILALWVANPYLKPHLPIRSILYSFLCFQVLYCGGQILNHSLTVWWSFHNRTRLGS